MLGALRGELAARRGLVPDGAHAALWVVDFPMFEPADGGGWAALHHPFTAPSGDLADPGMLRSRAYDLVLDGVEIGGGSIRIGTPEVQAAVLEILGIGAEEAQARFGFLLDALRYGAPPHGGIAMGIDRIVARPGRPRLDPRRHRLPQDRQRGGPADRRAGARRPPPAPRARPPASRLGAAALRPRHPAQPGPFRNRR